MDAVIKAKVMDMRLDVQSEPDPEPVILPFPTISGRTDVVKFSTPMAGVYPTVSREHLETAKADLMQPSFEI